MKGGRTEKEESERDQVGAVGYLHCGPEGGGCSHGCICHWQRIQNYLQYHNHVYCSNKKHINCLDSNKYMFEIHYI